MLCEWLLTQWHGLSFFQIMTANYYCCLPWDIHLQCTIMDPCTHINCRTQTAVVTPSHVRGGKRELKQPKYRDSDIRQVGKRCSEAELAQGLVAVPFPRLSCHGTRCCYQNLPGVMGLAGVTCKSEARRKEYAKKKRLLEVCGNSARETRL